ncbi:hypothetical protein ACQ4M4_08055 [Leptolyngbya sp. AN02str]|uniref:hypothetical protein n=1 Tax=Leptolyngbya sp. AN02str TaxID=3423363 RepID=UPI003D31C840
MDGLNISFVCCIESGWLEEQTIRMVESLRRWGGRMANAPVYAVTPRFGPPLSSRTHQELERLNVTHLRFQAANKYAWKSFLNKHYALAAVEEICNTDFVAWLDSDLLIVDEPTELFLQDDEDFAACAPDKNIGTSGPEDPFNEYWTVVCRELGMDLEDLPWVETHREGARIRLYWNSGVFVYRRSTGFAKPHLEMTVRLMDSHIASKHAGVYFTQHTLGLAMVKMGLRWRPLSHSHNYGLGSKTVALWNHPDALKAAKILHYHDAMWPNFWNQLLDALQPTQPEVAAWLESLGPVKNDAPPQWRLLTKGLEISRKRKAKTYQEMCKVI